MNDFEEMKKKLESIRERERLANIKFKEAYGKDKKQKPKNSKNKQTNRPGMQRND